MRSLLSLFFGVSMMLAAAVPVEAVTVVHRPVRSFLFPGARHASVHRVYRERQVIRPFQGRYRMQCGPGGCTAVPY